MEHAKSWQPFMISRLIHSRLTILLLSLLSASTHSSSRLEVGDWDIDDDDRAEDAGEQTIRINAFGALWNLNWLKFTKI